MKIIVLSTTSEVVTIQPTACEVMEAMPFVSISFLLVGSFSTVYIGMVIN